MRVTTTAQIKGAAVLLAAVMGLFAAGNLCGQPAKPISQPAQENTNAATATLRAGSDNLDNQHKLAIGDQVSLRILEDGDESKLLPVSDSGEIEVPYIGRRMAAGKTCRELAAGLKTELEKEYYYRATVIISVDTMTKSRGKVYLVGPIRVPGPQDIPSDETFTLSKAVLRAGGFTDFANTHRVKVTRSPKMRGGADQTFIVDVASILENGKTEADLVLEPGDMIYVPERLIRL